MGNSITDIWASMHPDFFKSHGYIGRGISGQTSYQFLLRFRQDVIDLKPRVVVINYGTNDIAENTGAYDEDHTFGNVISAMLSPDGLGLNKDYQNGTGHLNAAGYDVMESIIVPAIEKELKK